LAGDLRSTARAGLCAYKLGLVRPLFRTFPPFDLRPLSVLLRHRPVRVGFRQPIFSGKPVPCLRPVPATAAPMDAADALRHDAFQAISHALANISSPSAAIDSLNRRASAALTMRSSSARPIGRVETGEVSLFARGTITCQCSQQIGARVHEVWRKMFRLLREFFRRHIAADVPIEMDSCLVCGELECSETRFAECPRRKARAAELAASIANDKLNANKRTGMSE
jgi:hypothetical protein